MVSTRFAPQLVHRINGCTDHGGSPPCIPFRTTTFLIYTTGEAIPLESGIAGELFKTTSFSRILSWTPG